MEVILLPSVPVPLYSEEVIVLILVFMEVILLQNGCVKVLCNTNMF